MHSTGTIKLHRVLYTCHMRIHNLVICALPEASHSCAVGIHKAAYISANMAQATEASDLLLFMCWTCVCAQVRSGCRATQQKCVMTGLPATPAICSHELSQSDGAQSAHLAAKDSDRSNTLQRGSKEQDKQSKTTGKVGPTHTASGFYTRALSSSTARLAMKRACSHTMLILPSNIPSIDCHSCHARAQPCRKTRCDAKHMLC